MNASKILRRIVLEAEGHRIVCTRYLRGDTVRNMTVESRAGQTVRTLDGEATAASALRWARTELRAIAAGYRYLQLTPGVVRAYQAARARA